MPTSISRRRCLITMSILPTVDAALGRQASPAQPAPGAAVPGTADAFPLQDPAIVREMVIVSHGNLERVTALLKDWPHLANAAIDWGFGDWETCLGAASHTGRRKIAALLLEHGARPDVFAMAMLGRLDAVKALIEAQPGLQRTRGPHGLTLMHHARAGGAESVKVVEFLASLGDADTPYQDLPLTDQERDACVGEYAFGAGPDQRFRILVPEKDTHLVIQRAPGFPRQLFHQGGMVFHPIGAPQVRIAFTVEGGRAVNVVISSPTPTVKAAGV